MLALPHLRPATISLLAATAAALFACGPGVGTPMPEPPSMIDLGKVRLDESIVTPDAWPEVLTYQGAPGAAPANATVHITNLDRTDPVVATTAGADGSFTISVTVSPGDELRLQATTDDGRSAPADIRYQDMSPMIIVERPACLTLSPGYELDFAGSPTTRELTVMNGCTTEVTLSKPRSRLRLADFSLKTELPRTIAPGASAALSIDFARTTTGAREDVLFFDALVEGALVRYPITLFATGGP